MSQIDHVAVHAKASARDDSVVLRHRLSTRLWHWTNAIVFFVMLMSGLMIFNAHPRLYWGQHGANPDPAWLEIGSEGQHGYLRIGELAIDTTGVLGLWADQNGLHARAFPSWATVPSSYNLALSRRWHLTFAWLFAGGIVLYGIWSLANGHLKRDLAPRPAELKPRHILQDIKAHATLKLPKRARPRATTTRCRSWRISACSASCCR